MKKFNVIFLLLFLIVLLSACNSSKTYTQEQYQKAMQKSYKEGYNAGFDEGKNSVQNTVSQTTSEPNDFGGLTENSDGNDWLSADENDKIAFYQDYMEKERGDFIPQTFVKDLVRNIDDIYETSSKSIKLKEILKISK